MKQKENSPQIKINSPPQSKKFILKRLFVAIRFVLFLGIMITIAISIIPFENFPQITTTHIALAIGGLVITVGTALYFFTSVPGPHTVSTVFDLEAMTVVVISMIMLIVLILITLMNSATQRITFLGLIFMGIYAFYMYRLIKDAIQTKRDNEEIRKKYGELVEVDRQKSDFILVASHQLRTPLTEIKWSVDYILRNQQLDAATGDTLKKTLASTKNLARIVNEMFNAQALDGGANNILKRTSVDAAALLSEIINELALEAQQKNVSVQFSSPDDQILIDADKEKIKIAFENILDNAIRYSPDGTVKIFLNKEGDSAHLRVEDTGIGIELKEQGRIFTKFFRTENAILLQPDGSGVGLYATKSIIEKHGGSISFTSEPKKGTVFRVLVPLAHAQKTQKTSR